MKIILGCSLAAVVASMIPLGLATRSIWGGVRSDSKSYPRLELPVISNAQKCGCHGLTIDVSFDARRRWIFEDGDVPDENLAGSLKVRARRIEALGYKPRLRVRIAGNEAARHFLQLHRASTSVGIEDFWLAGYPEDGRQ